MSGTVPTTAAFSAAFGQTLDAFRLGFYNDALRMCGQARLVTLTDNIEARFLLDDAWNSGLVQTMLEAGLWYFATRTSKMVADPDLAPNFGYRSAYAKPPDWVRTVGFCSDERTNEPITAMRDEGGFIYCDLDITYWAYVSNDTNFGAAFGRWPQTFYNASTAYGAGQIVWKLTSDKAREAAVLKQADKLLMIAKSTAAMNESAIFLPTGSWVRSRSRGAGTGLDRGNTGSLYG